ncbi:MAG: CBS domain-containing protein, partial [Phycisphaerae bacterium]|nr:CBS domain-containing protein [Phycisphaerae bacterium]
AIILIVTTTTFIVQIIGPPFVKYAVKKAGEVGLNITEDDLIETYKVGDVFDKNAPVLYTGNSLSEVVKIVSGTTSNFYPVIDGSSDLVGLVTMDGIRKTFTTTELNDWLVTMDIMEPIVTTIEPDITLADALHTARKLDIDNIPVVEDRQTNKLLGVFNSTGVRRHLAAEVLARQQKADNIQAVQS